MQRREAISTLTTTLLKYDVFICFMAYWLQPIHVVFAWAFTASLIILVWLSVTGICIFLEFLTLSDEGSNHWSNTYTKNS